MTITRVTAYGEKWKLWCTKNKYTSLKCTIPLDKQDRVVITQDTLGDYQVSSTLLEEFNKVEQQDRTPHELRPPGTASTRPRACREISSAPSLCKKSPRKR